ncbi:hypothetical protein ACYULU_14610 [Breznakiellaceae bacterium SP9]
MNYKSLFGKFDDESGFIKTNEAASTAVEGSTKATLNRKGNMLLNEGKVEEAKKIFLTTHYSDGISRIGDVYKKEGKTLDALRMYWLAPDRNKAQPLIEQLADVMKCMIHEAEDEPNE